MTMIAVLKDDHTRCSPQCRYAVISFIDGDCYAYACTLYDKPIGWHPELKRLQECITDTDKKSPSKTD